MEEKRESEKDEIGRAEGKRGECAVNGTESAPVDYVGYEYKELTAEDGKVSLLLDCYRNFGWIQDENAPFIKSAGRTEIKLKRDRKIINRTELTRLQRHFEANIREIEVLERKKDMPAVMWSILVGLAGTAFMAGAVFAVTNEPPIIWLCILLAAPGFLGWVLPCFVHKWILRRQNEKLTPLIEDKYGEIYEICEKGFRLL